MFVRKTDPYTQSQMRDSLKKEMMDSRILAIIDFAADGSFMDLILEIRSAEEISLSQIIHKVRRIPVRKTGRERETTDEVSPTFTAQNFYRNLSRKQKYDCNHKALSYRDAVRLSNTRKAKGE